MINETLSLQSPMTKYEWWDDFLAKSENLTKTQVVKNAFSEDDSRLLSKEILHVISELCRLRTNKYGYRAYINDKQVNEKELNYIFDHPPLEDEDVKHYSDRVFQDKNFGMIINGCEKFSDPLSRKLLELIRPLLEIVGIPLVGLSVHTFVGNYGFTPLGIHKDHRGENVIHFHLGPGGKVMYNWSDEKYEEINGKEYNDKKDFETLLPYAEQYEFEERDIYFMPWNKHHLGKTDGLSIGVTVWFNNPPKASLYEKIFSSLSKQYMTEDEEKLKEVFKPVKDPYDQETLIELQSLFKTEENIFQLPFSDLFKLLHDDYKFALFSNSGWKTRTISLSDENLYDIGNYKLLKNKDVKIVDPFKIYHRCSVSADNIIIFARGSKIIMKHHIGIEKMIEILNTGNTFNTRDLISELPNDWPEDAGLYILGLLYDKRAIEFI